MTGPITAECIYMESSGTSPKIDMRMIAASDWMEELHEEVDFSWVAHAGDASHRRYFRVGLDGEVRMLMDAPPEMESCETFLDVCSRLQKAGLHAPEIFSTNLEKGFIILEDLGDDLFRDVLDEQNPAPLFDEALTALEVMAKDVSTDGLQEYSEDTLYDDLHLFTDLYLVRHKDFRLTHQQRKKWMAFCDELVAAAKEQPQGFVHKDFHSCNLLQTPDSSPGIIDFQDAVIGPVSYDFISLVWDRYVAWPREQIEQWMEQFRLMVAPEIEPDKWIYYCDLMGLQRNLRIVGRFAQLQHSENKPGYVEMIPRFFQYVLDVIPNYPQFSEIADWIRSEECAP